MSRTPHRIIASWALALALSAPVGSAEEPPPVPADGLKVERGETSVAIAAPSGPIFEYAFAGVPFKPYVRTLRSPAGINVLRDAPFDHLHHHALMYAMNVEDVTFWSEIDGAGRESHREFTRTAAEKRGDIWSAAIVERLDWIAPGEKGLLLAEERTIRAYDPAPLGATLLTWSAAFRAPEGRASVKLGGDHYHGLGARFLVSMDKDGKFLNPGARAAEVVRGDEELAPGAWCAYTAKADGKPVTLAMFDSPSNPRRALWFTMRTPFAYLAATINLWREPLSLESGKVLRLTYGVAVWDGEVEVSRIGALREKWVALCEAEEKASAKAR